MDDSNFSARDNTPTNIANNGRHVTTLARDAVELLPVSRLTPPGLGSGALSFVTPQASEIFKPTTPTEFLPSVGQWVTVGGAVMVGSFGAAIALSAILKYKVTVQAPASIRPVGELRLVQSTIEGSIVSISARENQAVRQGEQIATVIDLRQESKLQTKRNQLAGDIQKAKQQISAIDRQIAALDLQGAAERDRSERSIVGIQSELSRSQREYRDKQITTQAEVAEAEANWRTAQKERQVAHSELKVAEANLKSLQAGYQSAITRSQRYESAATAGAISTNQLEEVQLAAAQQEQSIAAQEATIAKQLQIVARVEQTIAASQARVQRAQAALNPSSAESATIVQKIAAERANGQAAIARLQQERQKLLQQRVEIVNQIATNDREIAQIVTELKPTPILAPISGKIQELNLRNTAQVVRPGDRIAQIVPENAPLQIEAAVPSADIDNVKVGQKVQMRVSACPYSDYGVVSGTVSEVAADAKAIDKTTTNAAQQPSTATNSIYEVTITADALKLKQGDRSCLIRSGMDGRADIISKEETVLQFILRKARIF
ncbi:HlyD family efflux transporter periplasmic adaptor subunit [Chamaesiphon polymorphus]|uniref:HlyD family secretion protein n=1 Tax=Chamaesiphon polymorphus CCALA 037 TaxID=2107692 RepID=A0A2T1G2J7_9CYAN|nr:HlyD family efflux transporter periplasmic adaptor subunit [Chamaesiphon polymorphus]PSB51455.1 HlyD family secretion protein [Chamaesiphon polymorphus CCALA 037]